MIWIDVTDVIDFLETEPSVTGIQRAALDLATAMCAVSRNCRTCAYCEDDSVFRTVSLKELLACMERSERAQNRTDLIKRRIIKTSVSLVRKKLRSKLGLGKKPTKERRFRSS